MKTVADGDGLFAPMWNAIASLWLSGTAVLSGCQAVGDVGALSVSVWGGTIAIGGTTRTVTGQICSVGANTGTETRYDLLTFDSSGFANVTTGATSCPVIPANSVPIAILEVQPGQTSMPADRVHDCRALASRLVAMDLFVGDDLSITGSLWTPQAQLIAPAAPATALLVYADETSVSRTAGTQGTVKSVTVPAQYVEDGAVYVDWDTGGLNYSQVVMGGATLGAPGILSGVSAGDTIELQLAGNGESATTNTYFRIYAYEKPISPGREWA